MGTFIMSLNKFMLGICGMFLGAMTAYNSKASESIFFGWVPDGSILGPVEVAVVIGALTGFATGATNG